MCFIQISESVTELAAELITKVLYEAAYITICSLSQKHLQPSIFRSYETYLERL